MPRPLAIAISAGLTIGVIAACNETPMAPEFDGVMDDADSAAMFDRARRRVPGPDLAPVQGPVMDLPFGTDSITIEMTSRECASPSNTVVLTSPVLDTLSTTMCQEPEQQVWRYPQTFTPGSQILLTFESGFFDGDGKVRLSDSLPVGFPEWNLEFEDSGDDDWDDFLLRIVAHTSDTLRACDKITD